MNREAGEPLKRLCTGPEAQNWTAEMNSGGPSGERFEGRIDRISD